MQWGGILFLLLGIFCLLPLRLEFALGHRVRWQGRIKVRLLWLQWENRFPAATISRAVRERQIRGSEYGGADRHDAAKKQLAKKAFPDVRQAKQFYAKSQSGMSWRQRWQERRQRTSVQVQWKALVAFTLQVVRIAVRWLRLEQLTVQCRVGWAQPSWTAYSYGLFWAAVSFLPKRWLAQGRFRYLPEFQQQRQEIDIRGIITCRIGHLILILLTMLWLAGKMAWEQRRKERIVHEG